MDASETIKLIKITYEKNEYGVPQKKENPRQVYVQVDSVTQSEFFQAGANGLKPEYRFTMFRYDYDNETIVEYNNERYSVYRTYIQRKDIIELYVTKDKGVQNGRDDST
jgi:SPP1 family predicted phage head-tail adaptor